MNDPAPLAILLVVGVIILFLWILWAIRLFFISGAYEKAHQAFGSLAYERNNALPLFMALMREHIAKSDQVFAPSFALRHRLFTDPHLMDEDEMTHQVAFLMTVADQHPQLNADQKFVRIRAEVLDREKAMQHPREILERAIRKWNGALSSGKWFLFPGGWFLKKL